MATYEVTIEGNDLDAAARSLGAPAGRFSTGYTDSQGSRVEGLVVTVEAATAADAADRVRQQLSAGHYVARVTEP